MEEKNVRKFVRYFHFVIVFVSLCLCYVFVSASLTNVHYQCVWKWLNMVSFYEKFKICNICTGETWGLCKWAQNLWFRKFPGIFFFLFFYFFYQRKIIFCLEWIDNHSYQQMTSAILMRFLVHIFSTHLFPFLPRIEL